MSDACPFTSMDPREAKRRLDEGSAVLIDVREPAEFEREHIPGARLVPLSTFDAHDFDRDRDAGKAAIFHCQSGRRTAINSAQLIAAGFREAYSLRGGINAWREAGLPCTGASTSGLQTLLRNAVFIASAAAVIALIFFR